MSDCEGCASKEAQIVFLSNRAALLGDAVRNIEHILDQYRDSAMGGDISEVRDNLMLNLHRIGAIEGLRVELDGKVLIEPDEKPGVHKCCMDEFESGPHDRGVEIGERVLPGEGQE